jgi:hypothetical protein
LRLKLARFAKQVWCIRGAPNGGVFSLVGAEFAITGEEHTSLTAPRRFAQAFAGRQHWLSGGRFVDDVLLFSKRLCRSCLEAWVRNTYSIDFEVAPEATVARWCHLKVSVSEGRLVLDAAEPNAWWREGRGEKEKERYPPWL